MTNSWNMFRYVQLNFQFIMRVWIWVKFVILWRNSWKLHQIKQLDFQIKNEGVGVGGPGVLCPSPAPITMGADDQVIMMMLMLYL